MNGQIENAVVCIGELSLDDAGAQEGGMGDDSNDALWPVTEPGLCIASPL